MSKILVVDDEKPITDIEKFSLEKEGYETILNYGIACYKKRCKVLVDK